MEPRGGKEENALTTDAARTWGRRRYRISERACSHYDVDVSGKKESVHGSAGTEAKAVTLLLFFYP